MLIRRAVDSDAAAARRLHRDSIRQLCAADYPADVIAAWADGSSESRFAQRIAEQSFWVATDAAQLLAFGSVDIGRNTLESLFVAPAARGKGLALQMLRHLERIAADAGIEVLRLDSSLTARAFYERHGYAAITGGVSRLRLSSGHEVVGVPMTKPLPSADTI